MTAVIPARKEDIFPWLVAMLHEMFELDEAKITLDAHLYEDLDIDSIDAVDLAVKLKQLTGKRLQPEVFKKSVRWAMWSRRWLSCWSNKPHAPRVPCFASSAYAAVSSGALVRRWPSKASVAGRLIVARGHGAMAVRGADHGDALLGWRDGAVGVTRFVLRRFFAVEILSGAG